MALSHSVFRADRGVMTSDAPDRTEHTVLVVYASAAGSTAQIAEFMANRMRERHLHVRVESVDKAPDPSHFEAVVLGSAIHDGEFLPGFADYVQRHAAALHRRPNWLFSVGMGPALSGPIGGFFKRPDPAGGSGLPRTRAQHRLSPLRRRHPTPGQAANPPAGVRFRLPAR